MIYWAGVLEIPNRRRSTGFCFRFQFFEQLILSDVNRFLDIDLGLKDPDTRAVARYLCMRKAPSTTASIISYIPNVAVESFTPFFSDQIDQIQP